MHGEKGVNRLCPLAFAPVPSVAHSNVPKSVCFPFPWPPRELGSACDLCLEGRILVQYAFNASSPMPCGPSGHWSPREAEGKSKDAKDRLKERKRIRAESEVENNGPMLYFLK